MDSLKKKRRFFSYPGPRKSCLYLRWVFWIQNPTLTPNSMDRYHRFSAICFKPIQNILILDISGQETHINTDLQKKKCTILFRWGGESKAWKKSGCYFFSLSKCSERTHPQNQQESTTKMQIHQHSKRKQWIWLQFWRFFGMQTLGVPKRSPASLTHKLGKSPQGALLW